jgi:UDP-N-acetylmuramoyl-L-alanyl-D-glutamate--2,6-diaminopimelate ligase
MKLADLVRQVSGAVVIGPDTVEVAAIRHDSRQVGVGDLFVAIPGFKVDGHNYLEEVLAAGGAAVAVQADREALWRPLVSRGAPLIVVPDSRRALAELAAALHGHPARKLRVIGVTGTDGKTSLAHLLAHVLDSSGRRAGLISTAECKAGDEPLGESSRFTTPEAPDVQAMLAEMVRRRCQWVVLEATSHGLALHRVDQCEFDIAVLTNIGVDHRDFHGSHEAYLAAKGRLFRMLDEPTDKEVSRTAVLNADDVSWPYFRSLVRSARVLTYALDAAADVQAVDVETWGWGARFVLRTPVGEASASLPRPGRFNVANAAAAAAVGLAAGLDIADIASALGTWPGAPGRMELIDEGQPFRVVVDFAHAPESLERVLRLLRDVTRGRLLAVFGCIGERDRERRAGMARAAARLADYTFVTDDNPYSEDRFAILNEIAGALRAEGKREGHEFTVIPDRREAIAQALSMAVDEDTVLLAGKGHETRVYLGDSFYECDDRAVAREILAGLRRGF